MDVGAEKVTSSHRRRLSWLREIIKYGKKVIKVEKWL